MLRIKTQNLGIGPHDARLAAEQPTELMHATRPTETEPNGATSPAPCHTERDPRIRELFFESHGAAVIEGIERGALGVEMRRQWRRHRMNAETHWPFSGGNDQHC